MLSMDFLTAGGRSRGYELPAIIGERVEMFVSGYDVIQTQFSPGYSRRHGSGLRFEPESWFCWKPGYSARVRTANHRAAASALSSGRVSKANAAPGAAL